MGKLFNILVTATEFETVLIESRISAIRYMHPFNTLSWNQHNAS